MQFLTSLFGGSENTFIGAALALGVVLVLILLGLWALKAVFNVSSNLGRGGNRRISVVDRVALDPKRQLYIVRRDNVEHLILTGGPQDVVVESGIAVELRPATAPFARRPPPAPAAPTTPVPAAEPTQSAPPAPAAAAPAAAPRKTAELPRPPKLIVPRSGQDQAPIERLREMVRPLRGPGGSLRHTGLMRPVSQAEPAAIIPMNPDNSDNRRIDSAKAHAAEDASGQSQVEVGTYVEDEAKAEGN